MTSAAHESESTAISARDSGRRLRIAFVVHDYNRHGGHARYTAELARRFRAEHDVHVFSNTVDDADRDGITFHHVPAWRLNALTTITSFIIPATVLVPRTFDIVHAQGLCGLFHNVATAHFCQTAWFNALGREGVRLSWKQRAFQSVVAGLERHALCKTSTCRVIAISHRIKDDLAACYGRTSGVSVIYHGTDLSMFHPANVARYRCEMRQSIGVANDRFLALYVGDMKKGAIAAIQAVATTPDVTLLIVSASSTADAKAAAAEAQIEDRVIFVAHSREIEKLFACADAFLLPTIYDAFGLVISEAMAAGLPVVTSRMAGASELITDGVDGLLTSRAWDVPMLAAHLARLRDDPELREAIGTAARARVEALTWDRTAELTLDVYDSIVLSRPESRSAGSR